MKKTIVQKCGGKSSGCCADIVLPYGQADNAPVQGQASSSK